MQIVITDGFTLNPGDLRWDAFHTLGDVVYYDRTSPDQVEARCRVATVIITNKTPVPAQVINACTHLKVIAVTATGYNVVDVDAAKKRGVVVVNVPEYGTHSVAQHTFALILELTNHVGMHARSVREGAWVKATDWSYSRAPIAELKDKVLGIVGLGKIGNQTARLAEAFGMNVIYFGGKPAPGVHATPVGLQALFSLSDIVSLHCPLKPDNHAFVNKDLLSRMKRMAFLINTSRGQLIHEADLADALRAGILAGAGLDVLSKEPPSSDNPLLSAPNCLITPHNAWLSFEARTRIMDTTFENVVQALKGMAKNAV